MFKRKSILMATLCILFILCISCSNNPKQVDFGLITVQSGKKCGYVNPKGEYVILPQFKNADFFRDGLAWVVSSEGKVGFIDKSGKFVIAAKFKDATPFSEGLAFVVFEGGVPVCIDRTGETKFQLKQAEVVYSFSEGLALFSQTDKNGTTKSGFVDKKGKIIINPQFDFARSFSEGFAAIEQNEKWGFIDKTGQIVINPQFEYVSDFKNGKAAFRMGEQWGFIDMKGRYVINPQFDEVGYFSEGLAIILSGEKWGFISEDGKIAINPQFDAAGSFQNGLAVIEQGDRYGYIDKKGKIVINPQFDAASSFYGNIAFVKSSDKWGIIDKEGKYLVNPQFDNIQTNPDNYSYVYSDFYDASLFVSKFFEKAKDNTFDGFSLNSTLQSIVDNVLYGDFVRAEDEYTACCYVNQAMTDDISVRKTLFYFGKPFYENVTTYSDYYGYRYETGSRKQYKFSEKITVLEYQFNLSGDAFKKGGAIALFLKNGIENRYGVRMESKTGVYSFYQDGDFSFGITYDNFYLSLYIGFNKEDLQKLLKKTED